MTSAIVFQWDGRRTACSECGSSDGFARIVHNETGRPYGDNIGKCHACGFFRSPMDEGFEAPSGELAQPPASKTFPVSKLVKHVLAPHEILARFDHRLAGALHHNIYSDRHGNAVFVYRNAHGEGTYVKTVAYDDTGHRIRGGSGDRIPGGLDMRAGFWSASMEWRDILSRDGFYGWLFNHDTIGEDDRPVVVVESEKTAIIGDILMPWAYWIATGGSTACSVKRMRRLEEVNGYDMTRLRELMQNRTVYVCLDNDQAGLAAAKEVVSTMIALGASHLSRIALLGMLPKAQDGWDVADALRVYDPEEVWREVFKRADIAPPSEFREFTDSDYQPYDPENDTVRVVSGDGKHSMLASRGGLGVLFGSQGSGKTRLIATAITHMLMPFTVPPPLTFRRRQGEHIVVLDIDQEDYSISRMMDLMAFYLDTEPKTTAAWLQRHGILWHTAPGQVAPQAIMNAIKHYASIPTVSLIVIDNLKRIVRDTNNIQEAISTSAALRDIAALTETTILVIGHTNPGGTKLAGAFGSQLPQAAQASAIVKRIGNNEDEKSRTMVVSMSDMDSESVKVRHGAPRRARFVFDDRGHIKPYVQSVDMDDDDLADLTLAAFRENSGLSREVAATNMGGINVLNTAISRGFVRNERIGNIDVVINLEHDIFRGTLL